MSAQPTFFSQVFPINQAPLPDLTAVQIDASTDLYEIGGGLSYDAYKHQELSGRWVWSKENRRLLTDADTVTDTQLHALLEACWEKKDDRYRNLRGLSVDADFSINAQAQADFVAEGLWHSVKRDVQEALDPLETYVDPVHVERRCLRKPVVVDGHPALQLSLTSNMTHDDTLREYLDRYPDTDLIGLDVTDHLKNSTLGTITEIVGPLSEHRKRLLQYNPGEEMTTLIKTTDGNARVVGIEPFSDQGTQLDYVIDALGLLVQTEHYERLNIPTRVQNELTLSPERRTDAIQAAVGPLKSEGWIGNALSSKSAPLLFGTGSDVGYAPVRKLADGSTTQGESFSIRALDGPGLVERPEILNGADALRIAVLTANVSLQKSGFGDNLTSRLNSLQLPPLEVISHNAGRSASSIREAVDTLQEKAQPHVLIAVLPNPESATDDLYAALKQSASQHSLPSQVILKDTLNNEYAVANVALGVVSKMGGIPFLLEEPLPYADRVVGLDIARKEKERTRGTMSVAASTHHFGADGRLRHYATEEVRVEGETLPADVLRTLFPKEDYAGKRILVHRDGPFRGSEADTLNALGEEIRASFSLVEVLKQGASRLYEYQNGDIEQISKGVFLKLSDEAAYVASSPPPFDRSTSQPLQVRVKDGALSIEEAIHSVLSFTLMHYGSVRPPRLPVTLHYSDNIAKLLMDGIHPPQPEGHKPYWL
jgi:hypothetical protein